MFFQSQQRSAETGMVRTLKPLLTCTIADHRDRNSFMSAAAVVTFSNSRSLDLNIAWDSYSLRKASRDIAHLSYGIESLLS